MLLKRNSLRWTLFSTIGLILGSAVVIYAAPPGDEITRLDNTALEETKAKSPEDIYQTYLDFFEEVYTAMENNYYQPVSRRNFERFLKMFDTNIYGKLQKSGKSDDFIRWRSAAYLVDYLKSREDTVSGFMPPKPAKQYEQTVLGKRVDLGIEGTMIDPGFVVNFIEPRSDAYEKGLRIRDLIIQIDGKLMRGLTQEEAQERLTIDEGSTVSITFLDAQKQERHDIAVTTKEYFKQTVFLRPVNVPGIYCLEIPKFNRKTSDDLFRQLKLVQEQNPAGLILDLRDNPGGPPLAAREISAFFLTPKEEFAYFQRRDQPKASLDVPEIPEEYRYTGPIVILVNEKSGSASELFSGALQFRRRAVLMGKNTAGQVLLKSMFHFDDESMVLLVTGRGHFPDGRTYSFDGVTPDRQWNAEDEEIDLLTYAARYLYLQAHQSVQQN